MIAFDESILMTVSQYVYPTTLDEVDLKMAEEFGTMPKMKALPKEFREELSEYFLWF